MELQEFISETIEQIVTGIVVAREKIQGHEKASARKAQIAPPVVADDKAEVLRLATVNHNDRYVRVWPLSFDVAITLEKDCKAEGGAKIGVGFAGVGGWFDGNKSSRRKDTEVARINFIIPILWPQDKGGEESGPSFSTGSADC